MSPCEVSNEFFPPFVTVHFPGAFLYRKDLAHPRTAEFPAWQERALVLDPQFTCDPAVHGESPSNTGPSFPAPQPEPDSPLQPSPEVAVLPETENHLYEQALPGPLSGGGRIADRDVFLKQ